MVSGLFLAILRVLVLCIDSLIYLSSVTMLVYRNATDFSALVLYPATVIENIGRLEVIERIIAMGHVDFFTPGDVWSIFK